MASNPPPPPHLTDFHNLASNAVRLAAQKRKGAKSSLKMTSQPTRVVIGRKLSGIRILTLVQKFTQ